MLKVETSPKFPLNSETTWYSKLKLRIVNIKQDLADRTS